MPKADIVVVKFPSSVALQLSEEAWKFFDNYPRPPEMKLDELLEVAEKSGLTVLREQKG